MEPTTEAVSPREPEGTVNEAALKLQAMMDSPPPEDEDLPVVDEPEAETPENPGRSASFPRKTRPSFVKSSSIREVAQFLTKGF